MIKSVKALVLSNLSVSFYPLFGANLLVPSLVMPLVALLPSDLVSTVRHVICPIRQEHFANVTGGGGSDMKPQRGTKLTSEKAPSTGKHHGLSMLGILGILGIFEILSKMTRMTVVLVHKEYLLVW